MSKSCSYSAPNGGPSKAFNDIYQSNGLATAVANLEMFQTPDFIEWYGQGARTASGEPTFSYGTVTNDKGEVRPLLSKLPAIKREDAEKQVDFLTKTFKAYGVAVNVTADPNAIENGYVIRTGETINMMYNPAKAKIDTIFHEYGHIYVDLIGYNDPVIQAGIAKLRGTELWNSIAKRNPQFDEEQLGKEVLTTAIGMEAAKLYNPLSSKSNRFLDAVKGWSTWVGQLFRKIAEVLGLPIDTAKMLAYELTSGKLRSVLTGKVSTYKQNQVESILTRDEVVNFLNSTKRAWTLDDSEAHYVNAAFPGVKFERATSALDRVVHTFDRLSALRKVAASNTILNRKYDRIADVEKLWADKREEGTGIHNIAQNYVEQRNAGKKRADAIEYALNNLHKPSKSGRLDDEGVRFYEGMNRSQVETYVNVIADFLDSLYAKGYVLYPEFVIGSVDHEVAGTIDLIAIRPDGSVDIFDFKTKEIVYNGGIGYSTFDTFNARDRSADAKKQFLKAPFDDIPNTTANKYALQLSLYKSMLEFYGITVNELNIVPLVGEIVQTGDQYNYTNVKMYTGSPALKDGVFKLKDLSARINTMFNIKDDVLDIIEDTERYEESTEELRDRLSAISDMQEWVKDVIADLHRSIVTVKSQVDKYSGDQYKLRIEYLIDQLHVDDEFQAIAAYNKYLTSEIKRMQDKLFTHVVTTTNGATVKVGYATMTWAEIKTLSEQKPDEYLQFVSFLVNAKSFLEQVVFIQNLPKTITTPENTHVDELIKIMKANEADISDLQWHINTLNRQLDMRYPEISSNPLYNEGDTAKAFELFFQAQRDETWMQANVDALADTHHPYIANVMKMYRREAFQYDKEARELLLAFGKETETIDIQKFLKPNMQLLTEMDMDRFYEDLDAMYREAYKLYPTDQKARAKYINKWYTSNTVEKTADEVKKMEAMMKKRLGTGEAYNEWKRSQYYMSKNLWYKDRKKAYYKPNPAKYRSAAYDALTDNEKKSLKYIQDLLAYLISHTAGGIVEGGYIPAVPNSNRSDYQKLLAEMGFHNAHKTDHNYFDRDGEPIRILPFSFVRKLNQKKLEDESNAQTKEELEAIRKRNEELRKENEEAHAAAIQQDLRKVIPIFIRSAMQHKFKQSVQFELHRVYDSLLENHRIVETKNGAFIIDKAKKLAGKANIRTERKLSNSRILDHYKNWLAQIFYDEFEHDEGKFTVAARVLQNYTSFKNMALNPYSAVNNTVYGVLMSRMEAAGGEFYSNSDWNWSGKEYAKGMLSYLSDDYESTDYGSKASAFIQEFPIMMDYRETGITEADAKYGNAALNKTAWLYSKVFFMQHVSEHMLQNRILLTMANSHRIVNGKIISYADFERSELATTDPYNKTESENKAIIESNKAKKKELKAAWEKYTKLYDAFDFELNERGRGRLKLKDDAGVTDVELADFQARVLGVNQRLHGIYNREDAGVIQRYALGRLAMQFRKWMRPGFTKRYGKDVGNFLASGYWNERRAIFEEGTYVTAAKFLRQPFLNWQGSMAERKEAGEQLNAVMAFGNLLRDYGRFLTNIRVHWHSLNDNEKANIRQIMFEWAAFSFAVLAASLYMGMKDDDEEKGLGYYFVAQQLDRSILELSTYTPLAIGFGVEKPWIGGGLFNEYNKIVKSPFAAVGTLEKIFLLGAQLVAYPFLDEEERVYQSGTYHDQDKLWVKIQQLIPIYNQYFRGANLESQYRFYRLF